MKCAICGFSIDDNCSFSMHIRHKHKMKTKDYYDTYLKQEGDSICRLCGKPTKFSRLATGGYLKYCSTKCRSSSPEVKDKIKATCLEKFGVENPYQSEEIKEKCKQKHLARFGVEHPLQNKEFASKIGQKASKRKIDDKEKFISEHPELVTKQYLTDRYGWMWYWDKVLEPIKIIHNGRAVNYYKVEDIPKIEAYIEETIHNNRSHREMELLRYVQSIYSGTIKHNCKSIISPKEIDIYLPDLNLGIEFNGTRWHSIEMGTPKDYHLEKSLKCRELGIRLIHIYEFEDFEEQKQLLKDLILGKDNYPKNDFNKNNLIKNIPESEIIHKTENCIIYGAGKLY